MCSVTSTTPASVAWYRVPHVQLTNQPNMTITHLSASRVSLLMWHVTPGHQYLGQYKCVATNSVTTTETIHNFSGNSVTHDHYHNSNF